MNGVQLLEKPTSGYIDTTGSGTPAEQIYQILSSLDTDKLQDEDLDGLFEMFNDMLNRGK